MQPGQLVWAEHVELPCGNERHYVEFSSRQAMPKGQCCLFQRNDAEVGTEKVQGTSVENTNIIIDMQIDKHIYICLKCMVKVSATLVFTPETWGQTERKQNVTLVGCGRPGSDLLLVELSEPSEHKPCNGDVSFPSEMLEAVAPLNSSPFSKFWVFLKPQFCCVQLLVKPGLANWALRDGDSFIVEQAASHDQITKLTCMGFYWNINIFRTISIFCLILESHHSNIKVNINCISLDVCTCKMYFTMQCEIHFFLWVMVKKPSLSCFM